MDYDYFMISTASATLTVDDIGNCAILASNDNGLQYILVIDTNLGATRIFRYGPFNPDLERLPNEVECSFRQIEYSESEINKTIRKFLNNYKFGATSAEVIDKEEALSRCRNIISYMGEPIY